MFHGNVILGIAVGLVIGTAVGALIGTGGSFLSAGVQIFFGHSPIAFHKIKGQIVAATITGALIGAALGFFSSLVC